VFPAGLFDHRAGQWSIRPAEDADVSRRYLDQTLALETTFRTCSRSVALVDLMLLGRKERWHRLGLASPRVLLRRRQRF
jgi:alpha,alpha-trehalase